MKKNSSNILYIELILRWHLRVADDVTQEKQITPSYNVGLGHRVTLTRQGSLLLIASVSGGRIPGRDLCKTPVLSSANEIAHEQCSRPAVM